MIQYGIVVVVGVALWWMIKRWGRKEPVDKHGVIRGEWIVRAIRESERGLERKYKTIK